MVVDPEAVQRALRSQFPAPELAPGASEWMREIVALVGSNPFSTGSGMFSNSWKYR